MFEVGDKVLVTGEFDDKEFNSTEAIIYRIGDREITLYIPEWVGMSCGHGEAHHHWGYAIDESLDEPSDVYGSWNVPREWLSNGNITLIESLSNTLGPHWKVIKKIRQMKERRERLGYK